ncbi:helix-turn-helix domain-containing protein [Streptomyces sp. NBC_00876]|uniref:helix-turn-helix domain-containing protein n=1 Tax=Streptomyces sp. NBC_00876 TaxID=2975853 RepID=UPI00386FFC50|nr:helix-turn-helix domain-containing protein [Streptomyces sp. NBC_00876]
MSRQASPEQRYRAVLAVLAGVPVAEVARRHGVSRQTLHNWRKRYGSGGEAGLADRSRRPHRSPARLDRCVEDLICALREQHPDWGARRLREALGGRVEPLPSLTTVHRVLVRNNLVAAGDRAGAPAPGDERLADLIDGVRQLVDRLGRALAELGAGGDGAGGEGGGESEGGSSGGGHGRGPVPCGLCPPEPAPDVTTEPHPGGVRTFYAPRVSLFEQPARTPESTMYRHGAVIVTPAELSRPAAQLTENHPPGFRPRRPA